MQFDASKLENTFKMKKEEWLRDKRNFFYDDPNQQLTVTLSKIIEDGGFTTNHLISVCEKLKFDRFVQLSQHILKNGRHLWFCIGNTTGKF